MKIIPHEKGETRRRGVIFTRTTGSLAFPPLSLPPSFPPFFFFSRSLSSRCTPLSERLEQAKPCLISTLLKNLLLEIHLLEDRHVEEKTSWKLIFCIWYKRPRCALPVLESVALVMTNVIMYSLLIGVLYTVY